MKEKSDLKFRKTLEDIRLHFDFLFKRGFRIASVLFADPNNASWQVSLMTNNYLINIYGEEEIINLAIGLMQPNNEINFFDLEYLAQFVKGGKEFSYRTENFPITDESQKFMKIARFLEKNFTAIMAQIEKEKIPTLNYPLDNSSTQQKRTII